MIFSIRIADISIQIQSKYDGVYYTCKEYLADDHQRPDIQIGIDDNMLMDELRRIQQYNIGFHSLKATESLLVHRLIAESLPDYNAFLLHGATVAVDNKAYLFTAKSGTGKTTHIYKWLENVDNSYVVNGDKTVLVLRNNIVYACGTPWCGKENLGTNVMVPLKKIVIMERSDQNHVEPMTFRDIFPSLLEQTFQPTDPLIMKKTLNLMSQVGKIVSFHKYYFNNFRDDAFQVSFSAISDC